MRKYVQMAPDGITVDAVLVSRVAQEDDNLIEVEENNSNEYLMNSYLVDGVLVERPATPTIEQVDGNYSISNCPVGTSVTIVDAIGDEVLADIVTDANTANVEFSLVDTGTYQVTITPPFPYKDRFKEFEVK